MQEIGSLKNRLRRWFQNLLQKKKKKEKKEQEESKWYKRKNQFVSFVFAMGAFFLGLFFHPTSKSLKNKVNSLKEKVEKEKNILSLEDYQTEFLSLQKQVLKKSPRVQKELLPILQKTSTLLFIKNEESKTPSKKDLIEREKEKEEKVVFPQKKKIKIDIPKKETSSPSFKKEDKDPTGEILERSPVEEVLSNVPSETLPIMENKKIFAEKKEETELFFLLKESIKWKEKIKTSSLDDLEDIKMHLLKLENELKKYDVGQILLCVEMFRLPISLEEISQKKYFSFLYETIKQKGEQTINKEEEKIENSPPLSSTRVGTPLPLKKEKEKKKVEKKKKAPKEPEIIPQKKRIHLVEKKKEFKQKEKPKVEDSLKEEVLSDYQKSLFYIEQLLKQYTKECTLNSKKRPSLKKRRIFFKNTFHFSLFFPMSIFMYFKNPLYGMLTSAFFMNNAIRHAQNVAFQRRKEYISLKQYFAYLQEEKEILQLTHFIFSDALLQLQELREKVFFECQGIFNEDIQAIYQQINEMELEITKKIDHTEELIQERDHAKQKVLH